MASSSARFARVLQRLYSRPRPWPKKRPQHGGALRPSCQECAKGDLALRSQSQKPSRVQYHLSFCPSTVTCFECEWPTPQRGFCLKAILKSPRRVHVESVGRRCSVWFNRLGSLFGTAPSWRRPAQRARVMELFRAEKLGDFESSDDSFKECRSCDNKLRLIRAVHYPETEETIRMFECDCGERVWDE
jgi:hypothetical protein